MAVRLAGMDVSFLPSAFWPFSGLVDRLSRKANPFLIEAGWDEAIRRRAVRDDLVQGIRATPGGAAMVEVDMRAMARPLSANAAILALARQMPSAAGRLFFDLQTGPTASVGLNQRDMYAMALLGGSVTSGNDQLPELGLTPGIALPALNFIFVDVQPPDWGYQFAMVNAGI